jgi:hypothetical protein
VGLPDRLLQALLHRKVIPFLGAGFSVPSGVPTWARLIADLAATDSASVESLGESRLSLPDLADVLDSLNATEHHALSFFEERVNDPRFRPSPYHEALEVLRPSVIITTNWDRLIEDHFRDRGHRVAVITRDADVPLFDEHHHINILKVHGSISDLGSLVYRKSQYEHYWNDRPLLRSLLDVLLSTHHALFLGYGFGDPNLIELLDRLAGRSGRFRREHWSLSYSDLQLHAVWQRFGITAIAASDYDTTDDRTRATTAFLEAILSASGSIATTNIERAILVNREIDRQVQRGRPAAILRMRAQLGWLSNPEPSPDDPVYGSLDQDVAERTMTEMVKAFLRNNPENRVRNIVNVSAEGLRRKYSIESSRRRLQELGKSIAELGEQVEIVHADQEHNMNEMIFDDSASLVGYKIPSRLGISRVTMHHDGLTIAHQVEQFDADFFDFIDDPAGVPLADALSAAREQVLTRIDVALAELAAPERHIGGLIGTETDGMELASALVLAVRRHDASGQTREDGVTPYWVHVFRVMERLRQAVVPFTTELGLAALLHDLVEDTGVTVEEIAGMFGQEVAEIVDCLTRREGMSFDEYLESLARGPDASKVVKLADRTDNVLELTRMRYVTYGGVFPEEYIASSERVLSTCGPASETLAVALDRAITNARAAFGGVAEESRE